MRFAYLALTKPRRSWTRKIVQKKRRNVETSYEETEKRVKARINGRVSKIKKKQIVQIKAIDRCIDF